MNDIAKAFREQSKRDIEASAHLLAGGFHEWACYAAQQAAEKSLKALRILLGTDIDSIKKHELADILGGVADLAGGLPDDLADALTTLSAYNQQTRYPGTRGRDVNIAPSRLFGPDEAQQAIELARRVCTYSEVLGEAVVRFWATVSR